jgi:hypothetical protein
VVNNHSAWERTSPRKYKGVASDGIISLSDSCSAFVSPETVSACFTVKSSKTCFSEKFRSAPAILNREELRLRYVFIDEAGTSSREPISVVVGIIVHADNQCVTLEQAIASALELIPQQHRKRCEHFHAKTIWGEKALREHWPLEERMTLLQRMMSIPREMNLALAVGVCRRDTEIPHSLLKNISLAQAHHGIAFQECIAWADLWIGKYAAAHEVATVIAEDTPETKPLFKHMARWLRTSGYTVPVEDALLSQPKGMCPLVDVDEFRKKKIKRIRMPIYFAEKSEEPLLQIADACAFGFRRFFSEQNHGTDFARSILGASYDLDEFKMGFSAGGVFSWKDVATINYTFGPWRG